MKRTAPVLLLLASHLTLAQSSITGGQPGHAAAPVQLPTAADGRSSPPAQPGFHGGTGFTCLPDLFNRSSWPDLSRNGLRLRSGSAALDLGDPLQVVVLFNAWHLPGAAAGRDIRLADLQKSLVQSPVTFTSAWPDYSLPGFVLLLQRRDSTWVLLARLSNHYLVEDRSGVGLVAIP